MKYKNAIIVAKPKIYAKSSITPPFPKVLKNISIYLLNH